MLKLQAIELSKSYRGRKVVDDVEVEIGQGEVVGLLGPNGAGKTTTFYMIVGLARPDSGRVLLNDNEITDLPMYLRARSGISYLPQEPSVFRQLTSEQNLLAVLETLPLTPEQQRDRLEELLLSNFRKVREVAHARKIPYRTAAYMVAIDRVTRSIKMRGVYA